MSQDPHPSWIACVLCTIGAAAMSVPAWASGLPFVVASLGPSLIAAAVAPRLRENTPLTLVLGHAIAIAAGLAALAACGLLGQPSALAAGVTAPRMLAVPLALGATLAGMLVVGRLHAPAGATALLVALGIARPGSDLVVLALTVAWVAVVVAAFPRIAARLGGHAQRRHVTPRRRARAPAR